MTKAQVLPLVLIVIDVFAAFGYALFTSPMDWRRVVYWLAAAVLTSCVTF